MAHNSQRILLGWQRPKIIAVTKNLLPLPSSWDPSNQRVLRLRISERVVVMVGRDVIQDAGCRRPNDTLEPATIYISQKIRLAPLIYIGVALLQLELTRLQQETAD